MRLTLFATLLLVAGVIMLSFVRVNATGSGPENNPILGPGKNSCADFIAVVDGNWSHPLNALHFHGYIAWAQGMISGHNKGNEESPVTPNADKLKMTLVEYCRDKPDAKFSDAVSIFFDK